MAVDHPSAPPTQPEPLENLDTEQKPLASALQKAPRHTRRVLPGLMDSEQSQQSERSQEAIRQVFNHACDDHT
jgi:hypothetical protein